MDNNVPISEPVINPLPPQLPSEGTEPTHSSHMGLIIGIIILVVILIAGVGGIIFLKNLSDKNNRLPTITNNSNVPIPTTTDLNPGVSQSEKAIILVKHPDSTMEKYYMLPGDVDNFIAHTLSSQDSIVSKTYPEK